MKENIKSMSEPLLPLAKEKPVNDPLISQGEKMTEQPHNKPSKPPAVKKVAGTPGNSPFQSDLPEYVPVNPRKRGKHRAQWLHPSLPPKLRRKYFEVFAARYPGIYLPGWDISCTGRPLNGASLQARFERLALLAKMRVMVHYSRTHVAIVRVADMVVFRR